MKSKKLQLHNSGANKWRNNHLFQNVHIEKYCYLKLCQKDFRYILQKIQRMSDMGNNIWKLQYITKN